MSKALELINEVYNTAELEKAARYQQEFAEVEDVLDKVASLAGADISALDPSEKIELWNDIVNQYNAQEGQGEQLAQNQQAGEAQEQSQVGATSPAQQVDPYFAYATSTPEKAQDFQMKVAESIYTSNIWAANCAERTAEHNVKLAQDMVEMIWTGLQQKLAGKDKEEEKSEDKSDKKHESFEAIAKGHAMKVKEEMKKEASFETAVALRAAEMILNGEV